MVTYHAPHINPYKTLPKDIPNRKDGSRPDNRAGPVGYGGQTNHGANVPNHFHRNNFGNRAGGLNGGYNNRGGGVVAGIGPAGGGGGGGGTGAGVGVGGMVMGFNGGGRNFSTPMVGMANGNLATAAAAMGGFAANPMNAMAQFGNFGRGGMMMGGGMRGGMQNLRGGAAAGGGRGGMASGMMANMIMPNMGGLGAMTMGGMGAAMAMPTGMPGEPADSPIYCCISV